MQKQSIFLYIKLFFNEKETLLAINTDYFQPRTVWVTIDYRIHEAGQTLKCIYSTDEDQVGSEVQIKPRNGNAVLLTVPEAGFVIYE